MRAGLLRHLITVQSASVSKDSYGVDVKTWSTAFTAYAEIIPVNGDEYINADRQEHSVTHKVRVRYEQAITPQNRFTFDSRTFNIDSVLNRRELDDSLMLMCIEVI